MVILYIGPKGLPGNVLSNPEAYCKDYAMQVSSNSSILAVGKRKLIKQYTESVHGMCTAFAEFHHDGVFMCLLFVLMCQAG